MSDQYGNNVDGEIRIPVRDWIDKVEIGSVKDGSQKPPMPIPLKTFKQWAFAHADGSVNEDIHTNEGTARQELTYVRKQLTGFGIPEEYHPVLMERTVETVASSWRFLSV
jgi:hypothetical protein